MPIQAFTADVNLTTATTVADCTKTSTFTGTYKLGNILLTTSIASTQLVVAPPGTTYPTPLGLQESFKIFATGSNANYETLIHTGNFNGTRDYMWLPQEPIMIGAGQIKIVFANKHKVGHIYITMNAETVA